MGDSRNNSVLVTGGRGFIGRAVGKFLARSGYRVVSLDVSPLGGTAVHRSEPVQEVECDITDAAQLQRVFEAEGIGRIIHLAAVLPTAAQRAPMRGTQVNIGGSLNLLEMARSFGVARIVFGSSLSVYGSCAADRVISETERTAPEDLYGAAKLYVERLGEAYRQNHGVEFISLRIGRVVGPGAQSASSAWRSEIFELLETSHAAEIALPYVGAERILLVCVGDVAKMLVMSLQAARPAHTVYNAACESVVVGDLKREVEALNANLGVKLGEGYAAGNPRLLDCSRFGREFDFATAPIFEQLRRHAGK